LPRSRYIRRCYRTPIARNASSSATPGPRRGLQLRSAEDHIDLEVARGLTFDRVWLREDISTGQRARGFRVLARSWDDEDGKEGAFVPVANGTSVARKRIVLLKANMTGVRQLRFQVTAATQWPVPMTEVAAFEFCGRP
jgi:hypothetical protein